MKILTIALLSLALADAGYSGSAFACGNEAVFGMTDESGNKTELILNDSAMEHSPKWVIGNGEPPLSVAKAVSIALAWAKKNYKRYDSVEIHEITLASDEGCSGRDIHWYYRVEFMPIIDGHRMFGAGDVAAVLMNGMVIGPTRTKKGSH
jgi:hypothetical protein